MAVDGKSSGVKDDMWAFTSRNPGLDPGRNHTAARQQGVLKGYNDDLSERVAAAETTAEGGHRAACRNSEGQNGREFGFRDIGSYLQLLMSPPVSNLISIVFGAAMAGLSTERQFQILTAFNAIPPGCILGEKPRPYGKI